MKTDLLPTSVNLEFHWKRPYSVAQAVNTARQLVKFLNAELDIDSFVQAEGEEGWASMYSTAGTVSQIKAKLVTTMQEEPALITQRMQQLQQTGEAWAQFTEAIDIDTTTSSEELFSIYKQFYTMWLPHITYLWYSFYYVEAGAQAFEAVIRHHISDEVQVQSAIQTLSHPSQKAHVLTITDHFRQVPDISERVTYLQHQYPWLFSSDPHSPVPTHEQLTEYATSFVVPPIATDTQINLPQLTQTDQDVITLYQNLLFIKDKRDEYRRRAFYYLIPVVDELINRFDVTRDQLWYIVPEEVDQLETNREQLLLELERRQQAYVFACQGGQEQLVSGTEARAHFFTTDQTDTQIIKGVCGSGGQITGPVQIVRSVADLKNFPAGSILVATTTNPDYITAMQKAIAVITDEGGITSHAAIVAREMKKPCIVGTKQATKALKNGDIIQVQADQGLITKL